MAHEQSSILSRDHIQDYSLIVGSTLLLVIVAVIPLVANDFYVTLTFTILMFVVLTAALNMQSGYTGYINFGFHLFMATGMYVTGLGLFFNTGVPYWALWLLSGLGAVLISALVAYPLLRIRGVYFAIAMLAVAESGRLFTAVEPIAEVTQGETGMSFYASIPLTHQYYAMAALAAITMITTYLISTSRYGLELLAIRENEQVVQTLGINTTLRKISVFLLSAFFAGIAGGINASYLAYINNSVAFNVYQYTLQPVAMAMIGGFGTVFGPLVGAVLIKGVEQLLWANFLQFNNIFFGIVVIASVILLPKGIVRTAQYKEILSWSRKW